MLSSCSSLYYFYQAGRGQLRLLNRGRPLADVIADPTTDPKLVELLKKVPTIKKFGEKYGLKPTANYSEYVKLDQDSVVYVVTVSNELEFKVKIFSFPIAGSFSYIGWFGKKDAEEFGAKFEKEGYDVDVRGASAYSTLGWFKDPLLSSMIGTFPDLVNVVLHESVHATIYINNQSFFNESLASFVADHLTEEYFKENGGLETEEWKSYLKNRERYEKVRKRMALAFQDLKKIYDSSVDPERKRKEKKEYLDQLQNELSFHRKINNSTLIQFQTYDPSDHGFSTLLQKYHSDVSAFLQSLKSLKASDFPRPQDEEFQSVILK